MNETLKSFSVRYSALIILTTVLLFSCKKEGTLGLETQPTTDRISAGFKDSSTVLTYQVYDDTIKTSASSLVMLGSYNDPVFGKTSCSVYTQLNLENEGSNLEFSGGAADPKAIALDSAVLTLQYVATSTDGRKFYGAKDKQTVNVYQLTQAMVYDSSYYSSTKIAYDNTHIIGTATFIPNPDSNVTLTVGGVKTPYPPHVRIKLDPAFAKNIFAQSGSANLINSDAFHSFMPGLYITSNNPSQAPGQGGIFYFDPHGSNTKMTFYYRRDTAAPVLGDTLAYSFEINSLSGYFTHCTHDYTSTPVATALNTTGTDTGRLFVQSAAGTRVKLLLPYLKNWTNKGPIIVNKAELDVKVDLSTVTIDYDAHPQLFLVAIDSTDSKFYFPIDYYDTYSIYGGTYDAVNQQYAFNITRHIQGILTGKIKNTGFYIAAGGSAVNAQRTVLYGASKVSNKLRLKLTYTTLH